MKVNLIEVYKGYGIRAVPLGIAHMWDHFQLHIANDRYNRANHLRSDLHPASMTRLENARRDVQSAFF